MSTPAIPYAFLTQNIIASCLIQVAANDSFFNPEALEHTGFAFDGTHYTQGVQDTQVISLSPYDVGPVFASWYTETQTTFDPRFRGPLQTFPTAGLVLLSPIAMSIYVAVANPLALWMGFLFGDGYALGDNYNLGLAVGFKPSSVQYANGIITVTLTPDAGSANQSIVAINMDFSTDSVYFDTALLPS